jgi:hypothetical protein
MNIFGHYLHHQPFSPTENTEKLIADFKLTKDLYFATFQESLIVRRLANVDLTG